MSETALRIIGTSVTLTEEVQSKARAALNFPIQFEGLDGLSCQRRGVLSPESYDVYDQWFHSLDLLWTAGSIQPVETQRISRWSQVRVAGAEAVAGHAFGSRPNDLLYIQPDRTLGPQPGLNGDARIAMLPTTYNVDSFAYATDVSLALRPDEPESWAWLLDDRWHGGCTLSLDPASSAVELALAARASGLVTIADPGSLTIEEIDALFAVLMARKRSGHFTKLWGSAEDSVRLMASPGCVIGALWSPAYYTLRGRGQSLIYAAPCEGYRGWHSGLSLSAAVSGDRLDKAYAYLNWWLDGVPGAIMARQGYYMSVAEPLRDTLTAREWDYWYGGLPAAEDLPGLDATIVVRRGERREGGSYRERVAKITVWSTIMQEHNYLIRKWRDFIEG